MRKKKGKKISEVRVVRSHEFYARKSALSLHGSARAVLIGMKRRPELAGLADLAPIRSLIALRLSLLLLSSLSRVLTRGSEISDYYLHISLSLSLVSFLQKHTRLYSLDKMIFRGATSKRIKSINPKTGATIYSLQRHKNPYNQTTALKKNSLKKK